MRRSDFTLKLISALLLLLIAAYLGIYFVRSTEKGVQTSRAMMVTAGESAQTTGYAVRDEYVVPGAAANVAVSVSEGQKVGVGQTLAVAYSSDSALERAGQIRSIKMKIQQLQALLDTDVGATATQTVTAIAQAVQHRSFDTLEQLRYTADVNIFGGGGASSVDMEVELNGLRLDLAALEKGGYGNREIVSHDSGIYSSVTDGYESVSLEDVAYRKPSELAAAFSGGGAVSGALGKLVLGSTWYYVAVMDEADADRLHTGAVMTVRFSHSYTEELGMTVESVGKAEDGKCVVVFSCDRALADVVAIRQMTAEVLFNTYTGILVSREAVHLDDKDRPFVYILTGSQLETAYIDILCQYNDSYICRGSAEGGSYLREGCQIVVRGNGLFDGKVISQ